MNPTRMCAVCRKRFEKEKLIRIGLSKDGKITVDSTGKSGGRGAYICKEAECIRSAQKRKALERAFSRKIDDKIYEELAGTAGGTDE